MDNGIDVTITLQPAQLVLIGTLLSILLLWMLIFAWLAIRPNPEREMGVEPATSPASGILPTPVSVTVKPSTIPALPVTALVQETGREAVLEGSRR